VYKTLIDVEDCEKKLAALPTNTSMRLQVEDEQRQALIKLRKGLADEAALKRFWLVRKGKVPKCIRDFVHFAYFTIYVLL
jgi:hypothetical protein